MKIGVNRVSSASPEEYLRTPIVDMKPVEVGVQPNSAP